VAAGCRGEGECGGKHVRGGAGVGREERMRDCVCVRRVHQGIHLEAAQVLQ